MVISIAGLVVGADVLRGVIFGQLRSTLGNAAAASVESRHGSKNKPTEGITANIIRAAARLVGATTAVRDFQCVLNRFWRVAP